MRKFVWIFFLTLFYSITVFGQNSPFIRGNYTVTRHSDSENMNVSVKAVFTVPEGYYQSYSPEYFNITIQGTEVIDKQTVFPEGEKYRGETPVSSEFIIARSSAGIFKILFNYQLCEESGTCYFPKTFEQSVETGSMRGSTVTGSVLLLKADYPQLNQNKASDAPFPLFTDNITDSQKEYISPKQQGVSGYILIITLAFIGGILLNIMPCVLPVVSLKTLHILQLREKSRKEFILHGLTYSFGIIATLTALGIAAAVLKGLGQSSGWGFQFQNPYFTISLTMMLFIFALAMFDLYLIQLPGISLKEGKNNLGSAFSNGVLAVLLATPCTAPFMGTALGLAFTLGPLMIILSFISIGIGLSTPFLLITAFPNLVSWIPKPGKWMTTFKHFLGFLIFATIGWLLNSVYFQIGWNGLLRFFYILLGISTLLWIFGVLQKSHKSYVIRKITVFVIILAVFSGIWWTPRGQSPGTVSSDKNWRNFTPQLLESERKKMNPVFIAFSAEWCLTCKTNETTVLNTAEIQKLFETNNVTLLYGDYTNQNPLLTQWIEYFGKGGVPVYAYYPPGEDPVILPELLSKRRIRELFN